MSKNTTETMRTTWRLIVTAKLPGLSLGHGMALLLIVGVLAVAGQARAAVIYSDTVMADNPVTYYRLNETSGSADNLAGSGLDGTYNNFTTAEMEQNGPQPLVFPGFEATNYAKKFDGNNTYLEVADNAVLDITGALTLEAWVNAAAFASDSTVDGIVAKYQGSGDQRSYNFAIDATGKPQLIISPDGTYTSAKSLTSTTALSTGTWYHLAAVFVPDTSMTIYINGQQAGTLTGSDVPDGIYSGSAPLWLGVQYAASHASATFNGVIDEAAVYGTALSGTRIKDHYDSAFIPEPSTFLLFGFAGLLLMRRRSR